MRCVLRRDLMRKEDADKVMTVLTPFGMGIGSAFRWRDVWADDGVHRECKCTLTCQKQWAARLLLWGPPLFFSRLLITTTPHPIHRLKD